DLWGLPMNMIFTMRTIGWTARMSTGPTSEDAEKFSVATSKIRTSVSKLTHITKEILKKTMQNAPIIVATPLQAVPHLTSSPKTSVEKETIQ
ncbi:hypothetical protein KI387_009941, partial [Taxus chinensis]